MRFHDHGSYPRNVCGAVAILFLGCSFLLTASAQDPPKPSAPREQAASSTPLPVIKTESRIVLVDAVVTDKKGNYIHDLTQQNFRVYEDNKEQKLVSLSFGSEGFTEPHRGQKHYIVLFFDNSSMELLDQMQARKAAAKFIEQNAGDDRLMAVAEFGGSLHIRQDFTAQAELLKTAVIFSRTPHMETNAKGPSISDGLPALAASGSDFGARSLFLSIRSVAKNLRSIPGRKMLILFSAGFPILADPMRTGVDLLPELTATIDACNKSNVTIYSVDVRGLATSVPGGSALGPTNMFPGSTQTSVAQAPAKQNRPKLVMASYPFAFPNPQKPGGGGGAPGGGGGGKPGGGPGGGGGKPGGGPGGGGGKPGGGAPGGGGGGKPGGGGGTPGGGSTPPSNNSYNNLYGMPGNRPRNIIPVLPASVDVNQFMLRALAEGTGGFTVLNTNDILGGLNRVARELSEFYILGYVPPTSKEGSCHTLKVKLDRGGVEIRSRSGYCNTRPVDPLEGKPLEKQMEAQAAGTRVGSIKGSMQAPYFYNSPDLARVNVAIDVPSNSLNFNKDRGNYHSDVNVLGIAYKPDGTVGARFSDTVELDLTNEEWRQFTKHSYHYQNQFDVAPGNYKLTVVFSAGGEHFGKFEAPIQIAPYLGKTITLGGVVLSTDFQNLDQNSNQLDAMLVEDRTPLIANGVQITPAAKYQFKKSDNVVLYSELYEPLLKSENPPKIGAGYVVFDKVTDKKISATGVVMLDEFTQKGNSVVPFTLKLRISDLLPGTYRLVLLGVDSANYQAPQKEIEFTIAN